MGLPAGSPTGSSVVFGPFRLDLDRRELWKDGGRVALTPKALDLLAVLAQNAGRTVTRQELIDAVWPETTVEENNLHQQIGTLRRVLGSEWAGLVETVPRVGYRMGLPPNGTPARGARGTVRRRQAALILGALLLLTVLAATRLPRGASSRTTKISSIAVLPFTNQGTNQDDAYLGFAIAEALIRRLGAARDLTTRPISAISRAADATTAATAGRTLGVDSVLTGTVLRTPAKLEVMARLVRVDDGAVLWSRAFERNPSQLFDLPNDIYDSVARELKLETMAERAPRRRPPPVPEAYEEYVRGRYLWNRRTTDGLRKSIEHFKRAIELDSNYALAWAALADAYGFLGMPEVSVAASRALALDDTLAEVHSGRALRYLLEDKNFALAKREFERSIELDPHNATAHHWFAFYFAAIGDFDSALREIHAARQADPSSLIIQTDVGHILYLARRHDESIAQLRQVIDLDPTFAQAHGRLALPLQATGRHEEALRELELAASLDHHNQTARLSYAEGMALAGRAAEARALLEKILATPPVNEYEVALARLALGERDRAIQSLVRAYETRQAGMALIKVEPKLDPLRNDPRFDELLARVGL